MPALTQEAIDSIFNNCPWFFPSTNGNISIKCIHCKSYHVLNDITLYINYNKLFSICHYKLNHEVKQIPDYKKVIEDYFIAMNLNINLSNSTNSIQEFLDIMEFNKTLEP